MRFVVGLVALCAALFASSGRAAEVPPPTVELRIRSVNQLLPTFEYLAGILNQAEAGKQGVEFLKTLTDDKTGIDGIDPARPFGMSITLTKDVIDSPVLVLLPLADEASFLGLLRDKLSLDPKKTKDGVYSMDVPNLPAPVHFRFTQGYVVATVMNAANIDDGKFPPVKDFFAVKPEGIADLSVHLDRIPEDVTKVVLAQLELKLKDELEKPIENERVLTRKLMTWLGDRATEIVPMLMKQGKLLRWTLNADAKTDAVTTDLRFAAKDGTPLAAILSGLVGRTGQPATVAAGDLTALSFAANLSFPPKARESFEPILEAFLQDVIVSVKPTERGAVVVMFDALKPTLLAGSLDVSAALIDAEDGKRSSVALSMKLVKGLEIEKLVKLFGPLIPAKDAKVTLNAAAVDGNAVHKIELANDKLTSLFGSNVIWVMIRDDRLVATIETDGGRIKALVAAKPNADASPLEFRGAATRLPKFFDSRFDRKTLEAVAADVFGNGKKPSGDTMALSLVGGKELRFQVTTQGKALKYFTLLDQELKK